VRMIQAKHILVGAHPLTSSGLVCCVHAAHVQCNVLSSLCSPAAARDRSGTWCSKRVLAAACNVLGWCQC
jgi:hypothetical protein